MQPAFPIPAGLEGFWVWDKLHCPRPLTPLEHELLLMSTGEGFSRAMGELGSGMQAVTRSINYYNYLTGVPRPTEPGETAEQRSARYHAAVDELIPELGRRWENEWLPVIRKQLDQTRAIDFATLGDEQLVATFDLMRSEVVFRWYIHGLLLYSFFAAGRFADFYKEALDPPDDKEGYEALQGFPTRALDSTEGLWRLSRVAHDNVMLRTVFETTPPDGILRELEGTAAGKAFLDELNIYLEEYGWRADSVYELTRPSWREDPSIPLNAIQGYIAIDEANSPRVLYDRAVARREELLAAAREKLASEPEKLAKFDELYENASSFTPIVEDHNHWIDQMGDILMRYPSLEIGRRLVTKGSLVAADDVFLLSIAELHDAMATGKSYREVTAQRRGELEHFGRVVPPPVIGVPPPRGDDPIEDVLGRFFGAPVEPSMDAAVITGIAASPGTARGPAKVVRDLAEASKLTPGDILVCEMTLPPWTPLFATAGAVVADTGGILSHCAIVAREYRIPCVVGTAIGTVKIKDGMILTVDGSKGIIRIE